MADPIYKWWHDAVIYEIYPKSFYKTTESGGIIKGIDAKLSYLKELGVDALWLCPIFMSPFKDSGYDVSDYYTVNPDFGTMHEFETLIRHAHALGIRIILDMVINHTSNAHPWFQSACRSKESPYRDYYIFREGKGDELPNNWISSKTLGPVWTFNALTQDYYLHIYTKYQPDLNWENPALRDEIYKMLRFWLDKGVDGYRLDVINKIAKKKGLPDYEGDDEHPYADSMFENNRKVHDYIQEMRQGVFDDYPECLVIGQTAGITPEQAYTYCHPSRRELDLYLQFEHTDIGKAYEGRMKQWSIQDLSNLVLKWQKTMQDGVWPTTFFGNHDSPRMVSKYGNADPVYKNLAAKMLCTLQLGLAGTQVIYMGDELALGNVTYNHIQDFEDIRSHAIYDSRLKKGEEEADILGDLRATARDNARYEIPWDLKDKMIKEDYSSLNYYKEMIQLRKQLKVLRRGNTVVLDLGNASLFSYKRVWGNEVVTVICNMSNQCIKVKEENYGVVKIHNYAPMETGLYRPFEVKLYWMEHL